MVIDSAELFVAVGEALRAPVDVRFLEVDEICAGQFQLFCYFQDYLEFVGASKSVDV